MAKRINDLKYWEKRIKNATEEWFSVYVINEDGWTIINRIHRQIIQDNCDGKILDAGCGYGRASEWIKNYTGIDFSPDFIEKAQKKYPNKKFVVSRLESLPFKDKEFDWAICVSIKAMIIVNRGETAWEEMEKELKRVAKKILILEYTEPERFFII